MLLKQEVKRLQINIIQLQNVLYRIPIAIDMTNCLFRWKKSEHDVKLDWRSQLYFWITSLIIQENTLCTNKIRAT